MCLERHGARTPPGPDHRQGRQAVSFSSHMHGQGSNFRKFESPSCARRRKRERHDAVRKEPPPTEAARTYAPVQQFVQPRLHMRANLRAGRPFAISQSAITPQLALRQWDRSAAHFGTAVCVATPTHPANDDWPTRPRGGVAPAVCECRANGRHQLPRPVCVARLQIVASVRKRTGQLTNGRDGGLYVWITHPPLANTIWLLFCCV